MSRTPQQELWCAVLARAVEDATSRNTWTESVEARVEARRWLTKPSADFDEVCALADLEPSAVRADALRRIGEADLPERAAPSKARVKPPTRTYTHEGETKTLREWAAQTGIARETLYSRITKGWPIAYVFSVPAGRQGLWQAGVVKDFAEKAGDRRGVQRARSVANGDFTP